MVETALILGVEGQIGAALDRHLLGKAEVYGTSHRKPLGARRLFLNFETLDGMADLPTCDVTFILAAEDDMGICRDEPERTHKINVEAPIKLAEELSRRGSFVVFPTGNAIFDGTKPFRKSTDLICPINAYGCQKAEAESEILALNSRCAVLRFTKVLGPDNPLINRWVAALQAGFEITPFEDMLMAPIPLSMATEILVQIARVRASGIYQASASRDVSYAEVAYFLADRMGCSAQLVRSTNAEELEHMAEFIPAYTTLDMSRIESKFNIFPPDPFRAVDEIYAAGQGRGGVWA